MFKKKTLSEPEGLSCDDQKENLKYAFDLLLTIV